MATFADGVGAAWDGLINLAGCALVVAAGAFAAATLAILVMRN